MRYKLLFVFAWMVFGLDFVELMCPAGLERKARVTVESPKQTPAKSESSRRFCVSLLAVLLSIVRGGWEFSWSS